MPLPKEANKSNSNWFLTVVLPILFMLLVVLLFTLPRVGLSSYDDDQPIFNYDFRLGAYPLETTGDAAIMEETGHYNLCFDELGERFVSSSITVEQTLMVDIYVSGLNLTENESSFTEEPVFTLSGYNELDELVRTIAIHDVVAGVTARVALDGRGISYFDLTLTNYAYDENNPGLALGVLISHMIGYDDQ